MQHFVVAAFLNLVIRFSLPIAEARMSLKDDSKVTPIQKVLQMMSEALAKGKKEKNTEEVEFAKFKRFCEDVLDDKTKAIEEAAKKLEQLNADIAKAESDAKVLGDEIDAHNSDVAEWEGDLATATKLRESEKTDYDAAHKDYSESIDAIGRALVALKKRKDVPQSLLQIQASNMVPKETLSTIKSFIALAASAPEPNAYENQSGGIISMLEKLLTKFEDELFALEKGEMKAKANFDMLAQKLTSNIKDGKADIKSKTSAKAGRQSDAADAKDDRDTTLQGKTEDEKTLSDTKSECYAKSDEFEKNQVVRAGEIKAIEKAMEILQSPDVSGNADKHLPSLVQTATALFQLRREERSGIDARNRVAEFLQQKAQQTNSRLLMLAASRVEADPFKKVKKMIKDMIVKLMEEANAEAEEKGFCDTELATNKQTRDIKADKVDELTAGIDEHTAKKEKLTTEIAELSSAIAETKKQQAELTALRDEEKAKNQGIIQDAKDGQAAVEKAIKVLKDFYAKASEASFLQGGEDMSQDMKAPYQPGEDGGIMGMLEVIVSDFARLEADTSAAEDAAQEDYKKFMTDADEDVAVKNTEVDHKTDAKQRCEEILAELHKDLEVIQAELDAALQYYEKLKPDCVDAGLSYEERVAQRKEEIVSLQEALKILSGEDLA